MTESERNGSLHYRFEINGDHLEKIEQILAENKLGENGLSIHTDIRGIIVRGEEVEEVKNTVIAGQGEIADSFALGNLLIRNGVEGFQRTVVDPNRQ